MLYDVSARYGGNSVKFQVEAQDTRPALLEAIKEAKRIFGYVDSVGGKEPTVAVKLSKEAIVLPD